MCPASRRLAFWVCVASFTLTTASQAQGRGQGTGALSLLIKSSVLHLSSRRNPIRFAAKQRLLPCNAVRVSSQVPAPRETAAAAGSRFRERQLKATYRRVGSRRKGRALHCQRQAQATSLYLPAIPRKRPVQTAAQTGHIHLFRGHNPSVPV